MEEGWVSRAAARQRAGRAGRVTPGVCVRLYSREHHECRMDRLQEPELQRVPLEELLLSVRLACDDAADATGARDRDRDRDRDALAQRPGVDADGAPTPHRDRTPSTTNSFFTCASEWLGECAQPPPKHALSAALSELASVRGPGGSRERECARAARPRPERATRPHTSPRYGGDIGKK